MHICYYIDTIKTILLKALRIVSAVMLPAGTLFFAAVLIGYIGFIGVPVIQLLPSINQLLPSTLIGFLLFVLPICGILRLKPDAIQTISSGKFHPGKAHSFIKRQLNDWLLIVILVGIGLMPIVWFVLSIVFGHFTDS